MSGFDGYKQSPWGAGSIARSQAGVDQGLRAYMLAVYNYMTTGLSITALVALGVHMLAVARGQEEAVARMGRLYLTQFGVAIYSSPLHWLVLFCPLAFVMFFSFRLARMPASTARIVFFLFAASMGLSLSSLALVYTGSSITRALFVTAGAFGGLSLYGYTTHRDLSAYQSFLVMGLFGVVIASLVNLFLQSSAFQWAVSFITLFVFAGLTAWDTQRIKEMYYEGDDEEIGSKKAVYGALTLYLDFINIFQSLLYLLGNRGEE